MEAENPYLFAKQFLAAKGGRLGRVAAKLPEWYGGGDAGDKMNQLWPWDRETGEEIYKGAALESIRFMASWDEDKLEELGLPKFPTNPGSAPYPAWVIASEEVPRNINGDRLWELQSAISAISEAVINGFSATQAITSVLETAGIIMNQEEAGYVQRGKHPRICWLTLPSEKDYSPRQPLHSKAKYISFQRI